MKTNNLTIFQAIYFIASLFLFTACGGGSEASATDTYTTQAGTNVSNPVTLTITAIKTFRFTWNRGDVPGATYYRLLENPDGMSGYSQVSDDIPTGTSSYDHIVPLYERVNASYIMQSCNDTDGCIDSVPLYVSGNLANAVGYFKGNISNLCGRKEFGKGVSLSNNGRVLVIGQPSSSCDYQGTAGKVFVFTRSNTIISSNQGTVSGWKLLKTIHNYNGLGIGYTEFGHNVSVSGDGLTIAIGSHGWTDTIDQDGNGNTTGVYIYRYSFLQQDYILDSNFVADSYHYNTVSYFSSSLSLSDDGNTLAVGAYGDNSEAIGINNPGTEFTSIQSGAAFVFNRVAGNWSLTATIKADNAQRYDQFGYAVSLSGDGKTLAVGAIKEDSNANTVNGSQSDNTARDAGAVYIYSLQNSNWVHQAYLKPSTNQQCAHFGASVSLSGDGNTLAVGAYGTDDQANCISQQSGGQVVIFNRARNTWQEQAILQGHNNLTNGDHFGNAVSLSHDGMTLAVGDYGESSLAYGINHDYTKNAGGNAGAAYVFSNKTGSWNQIAHVKASNTEKRDDRFGYALSLSGDGQTLAVGAPREDSAALVINGDQSDNSKTDHGAVYLY
ncbi:MAG: hypothetical protein PVG20_02705 [Thioalkalispiraceae bacterium]|jgi:hypothetical protein